jgi:O-antigen ligase
MRYNSFLRPTNRMARLLAVPRPSASFALLIALLVGILIAGGASRGDQLGQVVVRVGAWLTVAVAILVNPRPIFETTRPVAILLFTIVVLPLMQLIPLPPAIWQSFPGREILLSEAIRYPQGQAWRPLSLSPDDTLNALSSLIVPVAVLTLIDGLRASEFALLPRLLIGLTLAELLVGLVQLSGNPFDQPLINYGGDVSGTFANRNHFALSLSFLVLMTLPSLIESQRSYPLRIANGAALSVLVFLATLGSGSRSGMVIVTLAFVVACMAIRESIAQKISSVSRCYAMLVSLIVAFPLTGVVAIFIYKGRAESITRFNYVVNNQDIRFQGLHTVIGMIYKHFPIGIGFGSFSQVYRIFEPYSLLTTSYFNHAHNDFFEIVLDGGLLGIALIFSAFLWWLIASIRVWTARSSQFVVEGRLGSGIILLVMLASITDYPARTPLIMTVLVVAAALLGAGSLRSANGDARRQKQLLSA